MVEIFNTYILVKRYYFFWFGKKMLHFDKISKIKIITPRIHNDTVRMQGWSDLKTWWPLDWIRLFRKRAFIIELKDSNKRIGFTVNNFEEAHKALIKIFGAAIIDETN